MASKLWVNIATRDVNVSKEFYSHLGFQMMKQPVDTAGIVQFAINDTNSLLNLVDESELPGHKPINQRGNDPSTGTTLILDAENKEEVDEYYRKAQEAHGSIITTPRPIQGGYECVFADPDGYRWKVLYREPKHPLIKSFFDGQDNAKDFAS